MNQNKKLTKRRSSLLRSCNEHSRSVTNIHVTSNSSNFAGKFSQKSHTQNFREWCIKEKHPTIKFIHLSMAFDQEIINNNSDTALDAALWMQQEHLLCRNKPCPQCDTPMQIQISNRFKSDGVCFRCPNHSCRHFESIRNGSFFRADSHISITINLASNGGISITRINHFNGISMGHQPRSMWSLFRLV